MTHWKCVAKVQFIIKEWKMHGSLHTDILWNISTGLCPKILGILIVFISWKLKNKQGVYCVLIVIDTFLLSIYIFNNKK